MAVRIQGQVVKEEQITKGLERTEKVVVATRIQGQVVKEELTIKELERTEETETMVMLRLLQVKKV